MNKKIKSIQFKSAKKLERHFKGVANHRRIDILLLISRKPGITLDDIAGNLDCNIKTISEHTRRLVQAGLINKKYQGQKVRHTLSPYRRIFCNFIKTFQYS
jgi:DNA-binding MarR family transcriptional regulator